MIPYIDGLPVATLVASTDIIALDQGGMIGFPGTATTRQATLAQIFGTGPGAGFLPLIGGTITGTLNANGAGTGLAVAHNVTIGGTLGITGAVTVSAGITAATGTDQTLTTGGAGNAWRIGNGGFGNAFSVTSGVGGNTYGAASPNTALVNNLLSAGRYNTSTNTVTFSGSVAVPPVLDITSNLAGSSAVVGGTTLFIAKVGAPSDNVNVTDANGSIGTLGLITNHGGTVFTGNRHGLAVQMNWNTASPGGGYLVGMGAIVVPNINAGGIVTGFGTTQFGAGSVFGANAWARAATGATFFGQIVGAEFNASIQTGSSSSRFALLQVVGTSDHVVHGTNVDAGIIIGMQSGAVIGVKNSILLGDYTARWISDPNGYLIQTQGNRAVANLMAGGIDLNQTLASGSGPEGGGFYWRSPGAQVLDAGAQIGYGLINNNANGLLIDATYKQMATAAGSITVAAGGSGFTTGDLVVDTYGNALIVTAAAGVVTGVSSVVSRGWQVSPPADPVVFTARTRIGAGLGSGLTLNLIGWTAQTGVTVAGAASKLGFYAATPIVKQTGVAVTAAGIHAALTSLGLIAA